MENTNIVMKKIGGCNFEGVRVDLKKIQICPWTLKLSMWGFYLLSIFLENWPEDPLYYTEGLKTPYSYSWRLKTTHIAQFQGSGTNL